MDLDPNTYYARFSRQLVDLHEGERMGPVYVTMKKRSDEEIDLVFESVTRTPAERVLRQLPDGRHVEVSGAPTTGIERR